MYKVIQRNHTNEWGSKMFKNMQDEIYEHIKCIHTAYDKTKKIRTNSNMTCNGTKNLTQNNLVVENNTAVVTENTTSIIEDKSEVTNKNGKNVSKSCGKNMTWKSYMKEFSI